MAKHTVTYTETEDLAMRYVAVSPDDWIQNMAHERARVAIEEIVQLAVQKYLAEGKQIPGTKEEIVAGAYANGWIKTAAQNVAEPVLPPGVPDQQ